MILLDADQRWSCPNCTVTAVTRGMPNRFHNCAGLRGLNAPMVIDGTDCKVEAVERGDYINGDLVQVDGAGRPIMSVVTTRADGSNDCVVYAPTARAGIQ